MSKKEASSLDEHTEVSTQEALKKVHQVAAYESPMKILRKLYAKSSVSKKEYEQADCIRKRMRKSWAALNMTKWTIR